MQALKKNKKSSFSWFVRFQHKMALKAAKWRGMTPLMLLLISMMNFQELSTGAAFKEEEEEEVELLLSFKSSIKDPLGFLSNWTRKNSSAASFCGWHGITCANGSSHVTGMDLSGANISGSAAAAFRLPFIAAINLADNRLFGGLPGGLFATPSLRHLNLSGNNFTGPLAVGESDKEDASLSSCNLETLDLSNNILSGAIPVALSSCSKLEVVDLGGNAFAGEIPPPITNLTRLRFLTLASNRLVGGIPREIGRMASLKWIYVGYNNLSGGIPGEVGRLAGLEHINLAYNNLTGRIPAALGNATRLKYVFLYQNKLSGPIPASIFGLRELVSLDLSDNGLSGEIPELVAGLRSLRVLQLFSNNFTGRIPAGLASLPSLEVLQLWSNGFGGEIPRRLGERGNLTLLDLSSNDLSGEVPETLCDSGRLFKLILFSNSLGGGIPGKLGSCRSLKRVRLQNNRFSGELPPGFTRLPLVYYLDASGNKLSGGIDDRRWDMPSLEMMNLARNGFSGGLPEWFGSLKLEKLDLSENGFSGGIPSSYGNLSELMQLRLWSNNLSGEIPAALSSCTKLVSLSLGRNGLVGEIPASFSYLAVLSELDLSENQLSGEVPRDLGNVESLVQVNISHNRFRGSLPATGAFVAINATAVAGNSLCGGDANVGLPRCKGSTNRKIRWIFASCFSVALAAAVLSFNAAVVLARRRSCGEAALIEKAEMEDGTCWEMQLFDDSKGSKAIAINDVVSAAPAAAGGLPYRVCRPEKSGMRFLVKEVGDVGAVSGKFWSKMEEFGKLRHRNIANLIGICGSKKGGFLVYEYVEGKSLSEAIGGLSWERRLRVASGVLRALRFLHSNCSPSVYAGDLSPEKVIVDGDGEPRLRLEFPAAFGCMGLRCFGFSPYVAPEVRDTKEATEKGDIYGFGIILIGLLTGKSPSDADSGIRASIVEWARSCYSDRHLDTWIDPTIRLHPSSNQNEMVETMNLALRCTAGDPTARPCASDVYKTLNSITKSSSSCVPKLSSLV